MNEIRYLFYGTYSQKDTMAKFGPTKGYRSLIEFKNSFFSLLYIYIVYGENVHNEH